jgi:hypothetical protein
VDCKDNLQGIRFPHFPATNTAIYDLVEKPQDIREVNPKPAIQTAREEPPIHERIVTLDHHEPFTFQATHTIASNRSLPKSIENHRQASGQKASTKNRCAEGDDRRSA